MKECERWLKRHIRRHPLLAAMGVPTLRDFYGRLGWPLIINDEDFAAFELRGAVLALFAADKLAADGRAPLEPRQGGIRFTLGIMVENRDDGLSLRDQVSIRGISERLACESADSSSFGDV